MKKTLLALAAALLLGTAPALAQQAPATRTPAQRADRQAQNLTKELGLSPDQASRVESILLAQRQAAQATREQAGGDRRAQMQGMKAARASSDEQLQAVLSPTQFARYQQLRDERREQLRERRGK